MPTTPCAGPWLRSPPRLLPSWFSVSPRCRHARRRTMRASRLAFPRWPKMRPPRRRRNRPAPLPVAGFRRWRRHRNRGSGRAGGSHRSQGGDHRHHRAGARPPRRRRAWRTPSSWWRAGSPTTTHARGTLVAVKRLSAASFPISFTLSARDMMIPTGAFDGEGLAGRACRQGRRPDDPAQGRRLRWAAQGFWSARTASRSRSIRSRKRTNRWPVGADGAGHGTRHATGMPPGMPPGMMGGHAELPPGHP